MNFTYMKYKMCKRGWLFPLLLVEFSSIICFSFDAFFMRCEKFRNSFSTGVGNRGSFCRVKYRYSKVPI